MKTLALLGGAELTRDGVAKTQADEVWTMNWFYLYDWVPRIDRLFEMHPIWMYGQTGKPEHKKVLDHWTWLQQSRKDYPIYMLADLPQVPSCIRYPIEEITECVFGRKLLRGEDPTDFYGSTVDYMLALAFYEKKMGIQNWERIELYGIEMGSVSEYRYQRESAAFFVGRCMELMTVVLPENSVLLRRKRYGYEGGQMIFRQDLERMLMQWETRRGEAMGRLNHLEGQIIYLQGKLLKKKEFANTQVKLIEARDEVIMASAGVQLLQYQIAEIDLEEPDFDLLNPLKVIPMEPSNLET
jgi:hypothetical protein